MSLDRRLERMEAAALARTIEAVKDVARVGLDRHDRIPAYRALTNAYLALVTACEAEPPASWANDPMVKAGLAAMDDLQREHGMMEATPEQIAWRRTTMYRCQVVNETPAGQAIRRRLDALIAGVAE